VLQYGQPRLGNIKLITTFLKTKLINFWLAKQEPDGPRGYNFETLKKEKRTIWDGVHNNLALKHMKQMKPGDLVLFYHTGKERQAVGIMEVTSEPYPNPKEKIDRFIVVEVKYKKSLKRPITLAEIKKHKEFKNWELLRISRLSVMPVPKHIWDALIMISQN
jgi:predicted RNA-binding protein with PUA-like domain